MCGIAGIVATEAPRHRPLLERMVAALRHRGPDGQGLHLFSHCALGHTRLRIIDLAGGHQPMLSPDGAAAVVFNGEIYGYKALRAELRADFAFRTHSDTEVLLALHARHGRAMFERVPGMFAFALWDDRNRELLAARDRFGEKPFFYALTNDGALVFASELKAILASGLIVPDLDPDSVAHYLRSLYVHPHRTIYRNIHVLPPAHRLVYCDGAVDVAPYWTMPEVTETIHLDAAVDRFRELLARAVSSQLVADVPVGAFLSGGLDSSTIVALAAMQQPGCKTFSFGFGPVIDELPFARGIAERYGTEHIELSDGDADVASLLVRMSEVYDEPFGDSSNIPTFLLCQMAREHVTVALTGEGSDELLGGYSFWYRSLSDMQQARSRNALVAMLARVAAAVCRRSGTRVPEWAREVTSGVALCRQFGTLSLAHAEHSACFTGREVSRLVGREWTSDRNHDDTVDGILRHDTRTYLPGDILVKADRASMANGFELRAPFLDVEFASFCLTLPLKLKITRASDKVVLRRAFADRWTPAVRARSKQGFGAPVAHWLQRPAVRALVDDVLRSRASRVYDFVAYDAAVECADRHDYRTWALLVLALWAESARPESAAASSPSSLTTVALGA